MVYSIGWYPGNGFRTHGIIGIVLIIFLEINVYVPWIHLDQRVCPRNPFRSMCLCGEFI